MRILPTRVYAPDAKDERLWETGSASWLPSLWAVLDAINLAANVPYDGRGAAYHAIKLAFCPQHCFFHCGLFKRRPMCVIIFALLAERGLHEGDRIIHWRHCRAAHGPSSEARGIRHSRQCLLDPPQNLGNFVHFGKNFPDLPWRAGFVAWVYIMLRREHHLHCPNNDFLAVDVTGAPPPPVRRVPENP